MIMRIEHVYSFVPFNSHRVCAMRIEIEKMERIQKKENLINSIDGLSNLHTSYKQQ